MIGGIRSRNPFETSAMSHGYWNYRISDGFSWVSRAESRCTCSRWGYFDKSIPYNRPHLLVGLQKDGQIVGTEGN